MNDHENPAGEPLRTDLIDELFCLSGCGFLSDLPLRENWRDVRRALLGVIPDAFALKAWREAALYLCGTAEEFETAGQARDDMLERIDAELR